jgi:adenine deaminase
MVIKSNIVDVRNRRIFPGQLVVEGESIKSISRVEGPCEGYLLPGFIDAHIHIESSMLVPSEFARLAVTHGTVATVSDPHEIANVLGVKGVEYMIENGEKVPLKFHFGAPSCVPATSFETAGATIDVEGIRGLLERDDVLYLAEMMNYPGVIHGDPEVHEKLRIAQSLGKPIDGHAPGLFGKNAQRYIDAGITTDHECFTYEEALGKLEKGMKIIIREGSAAKNFDALIDLLPGHWERMMFCSDDKHPDDLLLGHINQLVRRAVSRGMDLFKVLQVACINPIDHYRLPVGDLTEGSPADFIVVEELDNFHVKETYIGGKKVFGNGKVLFDSVAVKPVNRFDTTAKRAADFRLPHPGGPVRVIEARDGQLVTGDLRLKPTVRDGFVVADPSRDLLKIAVVNRYSNAPTAVALIKGFGLREGAIASCVAHDSHNIIAVGVDDDSICAAVNLIIEQKGGISVFGKNGQLVLPLPIAGIMSDKPGVEVGKRYAELDKAAKELGSTLKAPFMTLSFMALLVIPSLKLSDLGLFDGEKFAFVE